MKSTALAWLALSAVPAMAADLPPMDCVIEPNTVVDLSSAVDGVVQKIDVDRGDLVEAGQVVAQLDSGVEEAALAYARARAEASSQLQAEEVNSSFAARRKGRLETLYKQQALSSDQMDETATEAELRRIQVQQAQENKRLAELDMRQASEILKRHLIRSPIRGVVVQRYLSPGESVEDKPILRLAEIDPLRAEVIIPVAYFGAVKAGQQAVLVPEAPKDKQYAAVVSVVDRVADAASGTFRARLSLPNPDYDLPSGLRCTVKFLAEGEKLDANVVVPAPRSLNRSVGLAARTARKGTAAQAQPAKRPATPARSPANAEPQASLMRPAATSPAERFAAAPADVVPRGPNSRPRRPAVNRSPALKDSGEVMVAGLVPSCHTVGPIASMNRVDELRSRFSTCADQFSVRTGSATSKTGGYVVVSQPQPDLDAAHDLVASLTAAGIDDVAAIASGPLANRVSAGVYLSETGATQRNETVAAAGFEFEVLSRDQSKTSFWVDLQAPADPEAFRDYAAAIAAIGPDLTASAIACPSQVAVR